MMPDEAPKGDVPSEMAEADRLMREALDKISEHVDSVTIFANKKREDGGRGTWRVTYGAGNYYARFGQIMEWVDGERLATLAQSQSEPGEDGPG